MLAFSNQSWVCFLALVSAAACAADPGDSEKGAAGMPYVGPGATSGMSGDTSGTASGDTGTTGSTAGTTSGSDTGITGSDVGVTGSTAGASGSATGSTAGASGSATGSTAGASGSATGSTAGASGVTTGASSGSSGATASDGGMPSGSVGDGGLACLQNIPTTCSSCMTQNASDAPKCQAFLQCYATNNCNPTLVGTTCATNDGICGQNTVGGGTAPMQSAIQTFMCACP